MILFKNTSIKIAKQVHLWKYRILVLLSRIFETAGIVAKSTLREGTFHGEEFKIFRQMENSGFKFNHVIDIGANLGD